MKAPLSVLYGHNRVSCSIITRCNPSVNLVDDHPTFRWTGLLCLLLGEPTIQENCGLQAKQLKRQLDEAKATQGQEIARLEASADALRQQALVKQGVPQNRPASAHCSIEAAKLKLEHLKL